MDNFERSENSGYTEYDKVVDSDHLISTGELPELFDELSVDDFIANLDDWD